MPKRGRKWLSRTGERGGYRVNANRNSVFLMDNENLLELDGRDGCTRLNYTL